MSRRGKSQWEFGELFPSKPERAVLTVSELTGRVKSALEERLRLVWVSGEVSNCRVQPSGHIYFTLKDTSSQLACVLFRGVTAPGREAIADGRKLILQGDVTVYEPRGQYQLLVKVVEAEGEGALQRAFERLKQKLDAEGLFAAERKRPLPARPQRVGVVTSAVGAALRDVLHVVRRRNPCLEIVLASCRVQGEGAAEEVVRAIHQLNQWSAEQGSRLDLILLTRGGGSLEDLWAFNEEAVARAIAASALPVLSAVGHEIDFTISDFVADLRAATPSAAAELITEGVFASRRWLAESMSWMVQCVSDRVERERSVLGHWAHRLHRMHPQRRLNLQLQRLDDAHASMQRVLRYARRERWLGWERVRGRWLRLHPSTRVIEFRAGFELLARRFSIAGPNRLRLLAERLGRARAALRLLSPESVLQRGYSITWRQSTGEVLRDAGALRSGEELRTRLQHGEVVSRVERSAPTAGPAP